jgi:hypothetical protein
MGFDAYVTQDMLKEAKGGGRERDRLEITPTDTKESIKLGRNGGVCEYFGCMVKEGLEWHHDYATWMVGGDGVPVGRKEGVYRNISNFRPTDNPFVLEAYEKELMQCTLLCKKHHTHTHTHHRALKKQRYQQPSSAAADFVIPPPSPPQVDWPEMPPFAAGLHWWVRARARVCVCWV